MRNFRHRFWVEIGLAFITGALTLLTLLRPDWIESAVGVNLDQHSGSVEWFMVAALIFVTVDLFALAAMEWLRASLASSTWPSAARAKLGGLD